jgi:hypothetical protein
MNISRQTKNVIRGMPSDAMTHPKGTMMKPQEDRTAGRCAWIIELAEELLNTGQTKMARALSSNILSLCKGLSREQTSRLRRILRRTESAAPVATENRALDTQASSRSERASTQGGEDEIRRSLVS